MTIAELSAKTLDWKRSAFWLVLGTICFQIAYGCRFTNAGLFILGYVISLVQLTNQPTVRRAFYWGLATGFLCAAPQLFFFWKIFGIAAVVLWLVFAFWIGLFVAVSCGCLRRWGKVKAMWLLPIIWTGVEYFRSELYYLRFSWLNIGYACQFPFGMYGVGFFIFALVVFLMYARLIKINFIEAILIFALILWFARLVLLPVLGGTYRPPVTPLAITGIQMEFPSAGILPRALDKAFNQNTNAEVFVLSEYTLDGGVPDALKDWCRRHSRYLVVGGKDWVTNDVYYNTAFVVGTNGDIVFKQAKQVPIQFFHDGLPAPEQKVWNSPWGKIGICICYDLSYTRVTDELVRQGAKLLIVPTMDVSEWGRHQHDLHARVAPVRAAEYGIPIFRLASSGISQAVNGQGDVLAQTAFDNPAEILSAKCYLPGRGTLPLDRLLAPICVVLTGIIMVLLLFLVLREKFCARKAVCEKRAGDNEENRSPAAKSPDKPGEF
ncbi:MAG TPA: nitrilase-related carbon-nitrogen hydrolase [Verrucomicrobiae bacterium]|jgi:apolipoprotein N-acyltransferase